MQTNVLTLFLCGDVMTGRGIDQILSHPSDPAIREPYMRSAAGYVTLAEDVNGPIPAPAGPAYIWGDALAELDRFRPDVRIINLETSVTRSGELWAGKGINYRMHPGNASCLTAAGIDICSLANNHVIDWGFSGLAETLDTLRRARILFAGAGRNAAGAAAPAIFETGGSRRVIVFAGGTESSGIPPSWAARPDHAGVWLLPDLSPRTAEDIGARVREVKTPGDIVVFSIHWGGNWGYAIPPEHVRFARALIDRAGIDIVHGHSSHHALGIDVYRHKPILYGCGDFINDYEGIGGYEEFRGDLSLMYFVRMDTGGNLSGLSLTPLRMRRFQVRHASEGDARWLRDMFAREGARFGTRVEQDDERRLVLQWEEES